MGEMVERRNHQNGPYAGGEIAHLFAEIGDSRLRACMALEEQRLHQQSRWQDAHEE